MKTGRNLNDLAAEIMRQATAKRDLVAPTEVMHMSVVAGETAGVALNVGDDYRFGINAVGHRQIATHTGIPQAYYDRMLAEAPDMLGTNVDRWFRLHPAPRMVRVLDNKVRAFLSERYRPLEYVDLAEAALPVIKDLGLIIMSCQITDSRLYIKAVDPRIERDVPHGKKLGDGSHAFFDTVSPAVIISNSEVGMGSLSIDAGVYTKACTNLAMIAGAGMKRYHLGTRMEGDGGSIRHLLSEHTKRATDTAIWLQVADVIRGAFDQAKFDAYAMKLRGATDNRITGDVVKVVDVTAKRLDLTEAEGKSVLTHLIEGGDLSQYGLFNAITRTAQDLDSYDRASDLERIGGQVIELKPDQWRVLAEAA